MMQLCPIRLSLHETNRAAGLVLLNVVWAQAADQIGPPALMPPT